MRAICIIISSSSSTTITSKQYYYFFSEYFGKFPHLNSHLDSELCPKSGLTAFPLQFLEEFQTSFHGEICQQLL